MDPYIEGSIWISFHSQMIVEIGRQLTPLLRPKYIALVQERFVLEEPEDIGITTRSLSPDVGVAWSGIASKSAPAIMLAPAPLRIATIIPEKVPHWTLEIRDRLSRELVTAIEVLSPSNKRGRGRREYLAKRRRLLVSSTHLLEIDLLHEGKRVPMRKPLPSVPYFVFLSRFEQRPVTEVWPITFDQPLPAVPVPLLDGDPDVKLDLQRAFLTVYDQGGYDLAVDYSRPPAPPLPAEAAEWAVAIAGQRVVPT